MLVYVGFRLIKQAKDGSGELLDVEESALVRARENGCLDLKRIILAKQYFASLEQAAIAEKLELIENALHAYKSKVDSPDAPSFPD